MSYEDLEEARAKRGRKRKSDTLEAEEDTAETVRGGRKRKSAMQEPLEPSNKVARAAVTASVVKISAISFATDNIMPGL